MGCSGEGNCRSEVCIRENGQLRWIVTLGSDKRTKRKIPVIQTYYEIREDPDDWKAESYLRANTYMEITEDGSVVDPSSG